MYNYFYNPYDNYRQTQFISDIERAINGEFSAIQCYEQLVDLAPTETERNQIREIRNDEIKHFQEFKNIYINLTGNQPQPQIIEECPMNYLEGLEFALKDEQNTVDFYLDIADNATNTETRSVFRRASADEQNHAVWFLYYYVKNK